MIAYEIHIHQRGEWKMDSVFDDRRLAMHEANKADESNRYAGVRVVEEKYDEETGQTTTRVIFRGGWADKQLKAKRAAEKQRPSQPKPPHATGKERVRKAKPPKETKQATSLMPVFVVLIVLVAGLAGLGTLYLYANPG